MSRVRGVALLALALSFGILAACGGGTPATRGAEPGMRLLTEPQYRRIIADLPRLLAPRGVAVLELGQGQQAAVEALAKAAGHTPEACRADLGGVPRALVLRAA